MKISPQKRQYGFALQYSHQNPRAKLMSKRSHAVDGFGSNETGSRMRVCQGRGAKGTN